MAVSRDRTRITDRSRAQFCGRLAANMPRVAAAAAAAHIHAGGSPATHACLARPVAPPLLPRPAAVDNNSTPALLPTPTPKAPAISRSWVQPMGRDAHDWWRQMQKANADTVTALNRGGKRLDLVLYGDSITVRRQQVTLWMCARLARRCGR